MKSVRLIPSGEKRQHGESARLYLRWMPHLGSEAVALYELLRVLPGVGLENVEVEELAELLRSTPESVEQSFELLHEAGFVVERDGFIEVAQHPPTSAGTKTNSGEREVQSAYLAPPEQPARDIELIRAAPEGISADDYFNFMGTLPSPHILESLNGYCEQDGMSPDVVREALRIASERDARRVGYVRSILERWVESGVKTLEDVERFEKDRNLRLVERGGVMKIGEEVRGGTDKQSAARHREDYRWFFGE